MPNIITFNDLLDFMMDNFEYKGYWYLPDCEDHQVAGILTFIANDSAILELIGDIDAHDEPLMAIFEQKSHTVIWGVNSDAKRITLLNCNLIGKHLNSNCRFPIMRYSVQFIITGKYVRSCDELAFNSCHVEIPALTPWCFPAAIQQSILFKDDKTTVKELSLTIDTEQIEHPIVSVDIEGAKIELSRTISYCGDLRCPKIEQSTSLVIKKPQKDHLGSFLRDIHIYEQFLSFAALSGASASNIWLQDDDLYQQLDDGRKIYKKILLHYVRKECLDWNDKKIDFLFEYDTIKDKYPSIIKKWYLESDDIAPIRAHLIESIKKKGSFSSVDFLIVFQAIEGFMIRFLYGDKSTIKDKLTILLRDFSDITQLRCNEIDIDAAVNSRHYYSHFFKKSQKTKILDGVELFYLTRKLRNVLICCMLTFIGFSHEDINKLRSKSTYNFNA